MPKAGQAQGTPSLRHCQQLVIVSLPSERTLFAVLFLIICCNNSDPLLQQVFKEKNAHIYESSIL